MNWIDLIIIVIILLFAIEGFGKSFLSETFGLFSFVFAFVLSLKYYNFAGYLLQLIFTEKLKLFSLPHSLSKALGFIVLWYFIEIVFVLISRLTLFKVIKLRLPGSEAFSILPAALRGFIFVALILLLIGTFPIQPKIKKDVNDSLVGSWILEKTYAFEVPLKGVFGELANDTLTFLTIKPKTNESVNLGFTTNNFTFDSNLEKEMIDLVNKERASLGLKILNFDASLTIVARGHSADMFKKGYFAHLNPNGKDVADRAQSLNISFLVIGENLAYAPSLELAHRGLMNSPGHRANILSEDFGKIGIGIADSGEYGLMFTQVFTN